MDLSDPHFAEPGWLWLALLGPAALLCLHGLADRIRGRQMRHLASDRFLGQLLASFSPMRRRFKHLLLLLAVAGIGVALARPQWGRLPATVQTASEDVLFLLDSSRSMLAQDVRPSRLERARLSILDFLQTHPGGRVGLVVFAGQAFLQCPLTYDHTAFRESLLAVDSDTIPVGGTDLGRALREAMHAVENPQDRRIMILVSDGEDLAENGMDMAKELSQEDVILHTLGVGTPAGAEIWLRNEQGQPEVVRDESGRVVQTRVQEETLRQMAAVTGGTYQPLGQLGQGLVDIQLEMQAFRAGEGRRSEGDGVDRFQIPLAALTALLVIESLVGTRRPARQRRPAS